MNLLKPEIQVLIATWVTFFLLLAILYKFAWKPILQGLDQREETIRRSLEEADKAHQEFEQIEATREKMIQEAEEEAKTIVNQSRKAAANAAKVIEQKARQESQILLENAQREIKAEAEKADAFLRKESAEVAVQLAGKILSENLDTAKNRKLIENLSKEI